jgi:hypothetical protein
MGFLNLDEAEMLAQHLPNGEKFIEQLKKI